MNKKGIFIIILFILIIRGVCSMGVSPGKQEINFEPNLEKTLQLTIHNTDSKFFKAFVNVEGELSDYVVLHDVLVTFTDQDLTKTLDYELKLPERIDKPGIHEIRMVVTEIPEDAEKQGTFIGARVSIVSKIEVRVPYPGKYAEAKLTIPKTNQGDPVNFFVEVSNYGEQDIQNAAATINIMGPTNEKIATIKTNEKAVKSKEKRELTASLTYDLNPGTYHAEGVLEYDGIYSNFMENFVIGDIFIDIKNIQVNNFRLGQVAKFDIELENMWSDYLSDIYMNVIVRDESKQYTEYEPARFSLQPLGSKEVSAYWDTNNVPVGKYFIDILLEHSGKSFNKTFDIVLSLDKIEIGPAARAIIPKELKENEFIKGNLTILTILVIFLIIFNIYVYFRFIRKKKGV